MAIDLQRSFEVEAPLEEVWSFLVDPERVVPCLPSARILEQVDERTFEGEIGFTLGPFGATFRGEIEFSAIEPDDHRVLLTGDAEDTRRDARARLVMESRLSRREDGGTRVEVEQSVRLSGSLAENMLTRNVADMLFGRFVANVQKALA
jgi:carbon monoxide dehydrogenase subunit G